MRILHTIQSLSARSGGPSTCTCDLMDGMRVLSDDVDLLTFKDSTEIMGDGRPWLRTVEYDCKSPILISRNFRNILEKTDYDLYHCNAIWRYSNHITCRIARKKNRPYVLSPHGMLYPTALRIKSWRKKPMMALWFKRDILRATCIHATCEEEMLHVRNFGYNGPIAVIPNPVVVPKGIECKTFLGAHKSIGFLGRLHPIKKVENIIYALALIKAMGQIDFTFHIMGKGDDEYESFLKTEVERLGLKEYVHFIGFVRGHDKYERLSNIWALFVPSEQENFGMIVPEALICGTPVYASKGTPWQDLESNNCGWWRDNTPETISSVILELFSKREADIIQMGRAGRRLVEEKYEQSKVAKMMMDLYSWILGEGDMPEFVFLK